MNWKSFFQVQLSNADLYADLVKFSSALSGDKSLAKSLFEGLENDPLGPQISLNKILTQHLGNEALIETSLPVIAISIRDTEEIKKTVDKLVKTDDSALLNFRIIGNYLAIGKPDALDEAQKRFEKFQEQQKFED